MLLRIGTDSVVRPSMVVSLVLSDLKGGKPILHNMLKISGSDGIVSAIFRELEVLEELCDERVNVMLENNTSALQVILDGVRLPEDCEKEQKRAVIDEEIWGVLDERLIELKISEIGVRSRVVEKHVNVLRHLR
jgi:hypothetical protein